MTHDADDREFEFNTVDDVLHAIAEDREIDSSNVHPDVLTADVWRASWGLPGCLDDSVSFHESEADAISEALEMLGQDDLDGDTVERAIDELRTSGATYLKSPHSFAPGAVTRVECCEVHTLL